MKVLTFSRFFPKGHPKAGQPTWFVEKTLNCFREHFHLPDFFKPWVDNYVKLLSGDEYLKAMAVRELKFHTIRTGSRFKAGDMASLRVWSDKPYRSKQIEFAQVEVKKVWRIRLVIINNTSIDLAINGVEEHARKVHQLAANDGLESLDFVNWFNIHPKKKQQVFHGQIICWNENIEY